MRQPWPNGPLSTLVPKFIVPLLPQSEGACDYYSEVAR